MEPVRVELKDNLVMYSMPPPGSGVLAAYILNTLDIFAQESQARTSDTEPLTYHRMAEAFKHAYAQRTKLADPRFEPEVTEVNKFARLEREIISLLKKKNHR
jgi:gamma-glutamyltranspeptidase/glutathione hydrolase/leukotriene-C4 hydrolase